MPSEPRSARPVSLRRRWLRRGVWLLPVVITMLVLGAVYHHYTSPERVRSLAETRLQRYVRGRVTVGSARFSWWKGVRLFDVSVSAVEGPDARSRPIPRERRAKPVFTCRQVHLTHDPLSVIFGRWKVRSVVAIEPTCSIIHEASTGRTNWFDLLRVPEPVEPADARARPTIELKNARVRVMSRQADGDRLVENLSLTIRAVPAKDVTAGYDVVWRGGDGHVSSGHSQIDLRTGRLRNVNGGLPWMSIEAVMLALDARYDGAGAWSQLLGLDGTVRATDYRFRGGAPHEAPDYATIELSDAVISIPINEEERSVPPRERYLRFDRVRGHVRLTGDQIRSTFDGRFHGSECRVSMTLRGGFEKLATLDDVDVEAQLAVKGLRLPRPDPVAAPAEARFVRRWRPLAGFFRDYDPHGAVDIELAVTKRAGPDKPVAVRHLTLSARDGDASCRFFPYRLDHLRGQVEYTPDGLFVRGLTGQHAGGAVTVDAWVSKLKRWAQKRVTVKGVAVPLDDALRASLPGRYRRIYEAFGPEGAVNVVLELIQPAGKPGMPVKWQSQATITLRDVSASYAGFPYPVDRLTGTLAFDRERIDVIDVSGRAGQARVNLSGTVSLTDGKPPEGALTVRAQDVEIDERLLSALPEEIQEQVRAFEPSGRVDLQTTLALDPGTQRVVYASDVTLNGVSARYRKFPVALTEVLGGIHVTPEEIVFDGLTGHRKEATFSVEGAVRRTGEAWATTVKVRTRHLRLDRSLRAAMPPKMGERLTDWSVDGPVTTETLIRSDPASPAGSETVTTVVRLLGATVRYARFPKPLTDVRAAVTIDESGIRAEGVEAGYGTATVGLDFDVRPSEAGSAGTITLSAVGLTLDESVKDLWPRTYAAAWERLKPAGSIDVHLKQLRFHPSGADRPAEWTVSGYVELHDVALPGAARLKRMSGTLAGSGRLVDKSSGTSLSGNLALATANLFGHRVTHVASEWSFARLGDGEGMFVLDAVRGDVYEGSLSGKLEVEFDADRTDYSLSATLHDVQIEPLVRASSNHRPSPGADRAVQPARSSDAEAARVRGLADGRLYLAGSVDQPLSRRGGGRVEIHHGHIYRLPLILAILHVLNLSVPDDDAFEDAQADFYIMGNRVQLDNIRLFGTVLGLVGSGSLSLLDQGLDLGLVNVSPRRWARVPVLTDLVEGASRELVELHVTGPLFQPTVRVRPLPNLSDEFKRLIQPRKPKPTGRAASGASRSP